MAAEPSLPSGLKLGLIIFFACVVLLLQALDSTIISTALPSITDEFHSSNDTGWYAAIYFLTMCAFQIFWGRLYTFYDLKYTYMVSIIIFEAGSLLCAVAPTSAAFIGGRALAGIGAGGVFAGSFVAVAFSVPLQKRPIYSSYLGAVYGLASVIGPPIGGAFTSNVTWRWCFYINLPLGGVVLAGLMLCFTTPEASARLASLPPREKMKRLDPAGTLLLMGSMTCLILALQWGGTSYAWSNVRVIVLLVVAGVALIGWVTWQMMVMGELATVPRRIVAQRSMPFTMFYSFAQGGVNFGVLYFVPVWLQGVKGYSAVQSGVDLLPFIMGLTVTMLGVGWLLTKGGYSAPFMLLSVVMVTVSVGLFTTWNPDTGRAHVLGYLALFGLGQGFGWQQPILIAQTMLPAVDIATGTALTTVCKLLGGTIFVSISETVFSNQMHRQIAQRLPQLDGELLMHTGTTQLRSHVDPSLLPQLSMAFNAALRHVWLIYVGVSAASLFGALGVEWRNVTDKVAANGPQRVEPQQTVNKE